MASYLVTFIVAFSCLIQFALAQTHQVTASLLNFRNSPQVNSNNIIARLPQGFEITVHRQGIGSWVYCSFDYEGKTYYGYVSSRHLSRIYPQTNDRYPQNQTRNSGQYQTQRTETIVLVCMSRSAYAYHHRVCHGLNRCKSPISRMSISEAKQMGRRACRICY